MIVLASDEFWQRVSGISDFRARLIHATALLSGLVIARAASEVARIRTEARKVFGDGNGNFGPREARRSTFAASSSPRLDIPRCKTRCSAAECCHEQQPPRPRSRKCAAFVPDYRGSSPQTRMERTGIEPVTSGLQSRRSPS